MVRKKNPQDATLRNVRAAHARLDMLAERVAFIETMLAIKRKRRKLPS